MTGTQPDDSAQLDAAADAGGTPRHLARLGARFAVPLCLVALIVIFAAALPHSFMTVPNWRSMIDSQAVLLILALAVTLPLRTGEFDLSIGAVAAFSSCVTAIAAVHWKWNIALAILLGLVVALAAGIVNSIAVLVVEVDAFIATLATMTILTGLTFLITNTTVIIGIPTSLTSFSQHQFLGLPLGAYYGWLIALALWYIYEQTAYGRLSLFVRGNSQAARLAGINVRRIRFTAFIGSAVLSGFAGIVLLGTVGAADPSVGSQYLLQPYAAAFLGATAIQLGRFNVLGTIFGLYLIVVGVTGLQLLGASTSISQVFYGAVLLIAVGLARLAARRDRTAPT